MVLAYRFSILILDTFAPFPANLASVARGYDACVRGTPTLENELSFRLNEGPRAHEILRRRKVGLVAATETRVGRGDVGGAGCGCRSRRGAETGRKIVEEYSALSLHDWPVGVLAFRFVSQVKMKTWTTFKPKRKQKSKANIFIVELVLRRRERRRCGPPARSCCRRGRTRASSGRGTSS